MKISWFNEGELWEIIRQFLGVVEEVLEFGVSLSVLIVTLMRKSHRLGNVTVVDPPSFSLLIEAIIDRILVVSEVKCRVLFPAPRHRNSPLGSAAVHEEAVCPRRPRNGCVPTVANRKVLGEFVQSEQIACAKVIHDSLALVDGRMGIFPLVLRYEAAVAVLELIEDVFEFMPGVGINHGV